MSKTLVYRGAALLFLAVAFLEVRTYLMLSLGYAVQFVPTPVANAARTYVNQPWAAFDPARGFRLTSGDTRLYRTYNHETVFDNVYHVNSAGFITRKEFTPEKKPGTLRFVVLGDSFTASEYVQTPWPDRVNASLEGEGIELYSFAQDPAGPASWHRMFFSEIVDRYEFDGVILAAHAFTEAQLYFGDTVNGEVRIAKGDAIPVDAAAMRAARTYPIMYVASDAQMQEAQRFAHRLRWAPLDLYFTQYVYRHVSKLWKAPVAPAPVVATVNPTSPTVAPRTVREGLDRLREVFTYCHNHGKALVISATPAFDDIQGWKTRREFPVHVALRGAARSLGAEFIDGTQPFEDLTLEELPAYFLRYDAHWNQFGVDRYAAAMADGLRRKWGKEARTPRVLTGG